MMQYQERLSTGYKSPVEETAARINELLNKYCALCSQIRDDDCSICELEHRKPITGVTI